MAGHHEAPSRRRLVVAAVAAATGCAWCGWVSGFHRSTAPARETWVVSLLAVVGVNVLLWRRRRHGPLDPGSREAWPAPGTPAAKVLRGLAPWAVLVLVVAAWEVLGLDTGRHQPHLTISALSQAIRPLNAAVLAAWMLAGIGYGIARAQPPPAALVSAGSRPPPPVTGPRPPPGGTPGGEPHQASLIVVPGIVGLLLPSSQAAGVAFWIVVVVAAAALELAARRSCGSLPTAAQLVRLITAPVVGNLAVVGAWIYAGYHLFAH